MREPCTGEPHPHGNDTQVAIVFFCGRVRGSRGRRDCETSSPSRVTFSCDCYTLAQKKGVFMHTCICMLCVLCVVVVVVVVRYCSLLLLLIVVLVFV